MKSKELAKWMKQAIDASISVMPVGHARDKAKAKVPLLASWKSLTTELAGYEEIELWDNTFQQYAIGVICGKVSGDLECFDFDVNDKGNNIYEEWKDLVLRIYPKIFDNAYVQTTPSGGVHFVFRVYGAVPGNQKFAKNDQGKTIIETRGQGGMFVCAPSEGYTHISGDLFKLPPISLEVRNGLADIAKAFNVFTQPSKFELQRVNVNERAKVMAPDGVSVFDDYERSVNYETILRSDGWYLFAKRANGETLWRRPGKERGGPSATLGYSRTRKGTPKLYVFSENAPLPANQSYSASAYYAFTKHGGDFKEAAKDLQGQGYGMPSFKIAKNIEEIETAPDVSEELHTIADKIIEAVNIGEIGESQVAADLLVNEYRYDNIESRWYRRKFHWEQDNGETIRITVSEAMRNAYKSAYRTMLILSNRYPDKYKSAQAEQIVKEIKPLGNVKKINNIVGLLKSSERLGTDEYTIWDNCPDHYPFANGLVNLRTGQLEAPNPNMLVRSFSQVAYDENADEPEEFLKFLRSTFSPNHEEIIPFIQRLFGYSMYGRQSEAVFPILHGRRGRNGKDTLIAAIQNVFGRMAKPVQLSLVIDQPSSAKEMAELYELYGSRIAWMNEPDDNFKPSSGRIKRLTGGGKISARPLHGKFVTWEQTHTLFLISNPTPKLPTGDEALWRRIVLVPFDNVFVESPSRDPSRREFQADKMLLKKLYAEASQIAKWLVKGATDYHREKSLNTPEFLVTATRKYRTELDLIDMFYSECFIHTPDERRPMREVYLMYCAWLKDHAKREPIVYARFVEETKSHRYDVEIEASSGESVLVNLATKDEGRKYDQGVSLSWR